MRFVWQAWEGQISPRFEIYNYKSFRKDLKLFVVRTQSYLASGAKHVKTLLADKDKVKVTLRGIGDGKPKVKKDTGNKVAQLQKSAEDAKGTINRDSVSELTCAKNAEKTFETARTPVGLFLEDSRGKGCNCSDPQEAQLLSGQCVTAEVLH